MTYMVTLELWMVLPLTTVGALLCLWRWITTRNDFVSLMWVVVGTSCIGGFATVLCTLAEERERPQRDASKQQGREDAEVGLPYEASPPRYTRDWQQGWIERKREKR